MDENKALEHIATHLVERVGLDYRQERLPLLASSVRQRIDALSLSSTREYLDYLERVAGEWSRLINQVTVTETSFYRYPSLVEAVSHVLAELHSARAANRPIHIWSAAAAEGQEAYTLAMSALASNIAPARPVVIWATDVNTEALARAEQARYPPSDVASLPRAWQQRYLQWHSDGTCSPTEEVRQLVRFLPFNLKSLLEGQRPPFAPDIIVCANVLIYFPPDLAKAVMLTLSRLIPQDGMIFFDKAVSYLARDVLRPVHVRSAIGYRPPRPASARGHRPKRKGLSPVRRGQKARTRGPSPPAGSSRAAPAPPASHARPHPQPEPSPPREDVIARLVDTGRWEEAEAQLTAWREHAPLDARPHFLLGRLYRLQGKWEQARACYERALYLRPSLSVAHLEYGNLLRTLGDVRGAQRAYRHALHAAQNDSESQKYGFSPALIRHLAGRALRET